MQNEINADDAHAHIACAVCTVAYDGTPAVPAAIVVGRRDSILSVWIWSAGLSASSPETLLRLTAAAPLEAKVKSHAAVGRAPREYFDL